MKPLEYEQLSELYDRERQQQTSLIEHYTRRIERLKTKLRNIKKSSAAAQNELQEIQNGEDALKEEVHKLQECVNEQEEERQSFLAEKKMTEDALSAMQTQFECQKVQLESYKKELREFANGSETDIIAKFIHAMFKFPDANSVYKIVCMKAVRALFDMDLKDAKEFVEAAMCGEKGGEIVWVPTDDDPGRHEDESKRAVKTTYRGFKLYVYPDGCYGEKKPFWKVNYPNSMDQSSAGEISSKEEGQRLAVAWVDKFHDLKK